MVTTRGVVTLKIMDRFTFIRPFFFAENENLMFEILYTCLEFLKICAGNSEGSKVSILGCKIDFCIEK